MGQIWIKQYYEFIKKKRACQQHNQTPLGISIFTTILEIGKSSCLKAKLSPLLILNGCGGEFSIYCYKGNNL